MMEKADVILRLSNISKQYRLGLIGADTLSDDLKRWWHKIRGKEDPFLKVGEVNNQRSVGKSDYVWALQDITFEVSEGEVLGIIGNNGAGKSTLLKILSRVTPPTTGEVKTKGRIASLLEVGTGFHPELTGMENIYLNGAILGMTKKEIRSKIDEIIVFSGCERFINTPVKRYSSGMRVRLAFAVAAFLEPDILVIDEVLAVGDAEFQKKAIGKMQDISQSQGRTVLFVSHNMAAVKSLCDRAFVLEQGRIAFKGDVDRAVQFYLKKNTNEEGTQYQYTKDDANQTENFEIVSSGVRATGKTYGDVITRDDNIVFDTRLKRKRGIDVNLTYRLKDDMGNFLFTTGCPKEVSDLRIGLIDIEMMIPNYFFNEGNFYVDVMLTDGKNRLFLQVDVLVFTVVQEKKQLGTWMGKTKGALKPRFEWVIKSKE